ncbi:hypothetical protein N7539_003036 [Penicillium diatomitis]|uniref:Uncharacterized protein n=1 Tax=Penicillium diatomitis TaxID=2819901 RepID=A0A9W9XFV3_9EURO|nr:uncharacterized protein N7539_003036 [Penicillium diatomitis]KAJ5491469.1 hypothetical protein N7539_003036 [Penicillium diatomitis]
MDPEMFMRDRQHFREKLLGWVRILSDESVSETAYVEIVAELNDMVRDIEILGQPPPLRTLQAEDFDLIDSTFPPTSENHGEEHDDPDGFEMIHPLAEADFGRLCSKDGAVRDTLSWAGELLRRRNAPFADIAVILDMLALHIGRLRLMRDKKDEDELQDGEGIGVDAYADEMDEMARVEHESRQQLPNEYLRAIWNRLYSCMDCNCDKCGLVARH